MTEFSRKFSIADIALLFVASICLITTAVQYPLSTTFPMGGDGAAIIHNVQHIGIRPIATLRTIIHSWYPAAYILFSVNALIPFVSWPILFSWWMALGQILTGAALGLLVYRLAGIRAGAIAIGLWALTPITMTSFFEDGTMAQLWSLVWITLFFERMAAKSMIGMIICACIAFFSHPITGLLLVATLCMTIPLSWIALHHPSKPQKTIRKILSWSMIILLGIAGYVIWLRNSVLFIHFQQESSRYTPQMFHGFFFPWTLASIYGWIAFVQKQKTHPLLWISFGNFFFLSFLLATNDFLGIGFWTNRLNGYLLICIIVGAAIGLTELFNMLKAPKTSFLIATFCIVGLSMSAYHDNKPLYKRYESSSTYVRIHPDELTGIEWIKNNTPLHARVYSSSATRNYEWIPVLSDRYWKAIGSQELRTIQRQGAEEYNVLVFFTRKESVPSDIASKPETFQELYNHNGVVLFRIMSL